MLKAKNFSITTMNALTSKKKYIYPNQPQPNSNYLRQKLNKNNKNIHNDDCILVATTTKKLFYHQRTKKSCVIGEVKANFFATTVN